MYNYEFATVQDVTGDESQACAQEPQSFGLNHPGDSFQHQDPPPQFELINNLYRSKLLARFDLTATCKLVLYALVHHYNPNNEDMFPSQRYIAQTLGISERSVERAVKELANKGLVMYVTRNVNRYKFTRLFFNTAAGENPSTKQENTSIQQENPAKPKENPPNYPNHSPQITPATSLKPPADKLSGTNRQIVRSCHRQIVGQTYNNEQKNKKPDFKKFFGQQDPQTRHYPNIAETQAMLKKQRDDAKLAIAPKDFDRDTALRWLKKLPRQFHDGVLAREVYEKHGFAPRDVSG